MKGQGWTAEADARLDRLWGQGLTAQAIAFQLGFTRSSVLGRLHRRGMKRGLREKPGEKFEQLIDLVVDAPIDDPVPIEIAAAMVGLPAKDARRRWARLCERLGPQATPGNQYRRLGR